jgi:hypothetical protein
LLLASLVDLAGTGRKVAACVEPGLPGPLPVGAAAAVPSSIQPAPSWCATNGGFHYYRTASCGVFSARVVVYDVETQAVVGTIDYNFIDYSYTAADISTWAHQLSIQETAQTGLGAGSSVSGSFACSGACTISSSRFPPQPVEPGRFEDGESYYTTTATAPGAVGTAQTTVTWTFTNPAWAGPSTPDSSQQLPVRCDHALPGTSSIGCVFPAYTPVAIYSRTGPYPELARHLGDAQASGLPGAYPGAAPLTRLTDSALQDRNRATACPPRYPRPAGKSCDEYPFASANQGAFTGGGAPRTSPWCQIDIGAPGSTGPTGYSVCMIDATQNTNGGSELGGFYNRNRVLSNDPYQVWITT